MNFITSLAPQLLKQHPKKIVISGPSGFLGSRVVDTLINVQQHRRDHGLEPGELMLLSSSPGTMMERLVQKYGQAKMSSIRASRVDYYTQHKHVVWTDHLGSLGCSGADSVFINMAAVSGPQPEKSKDAMMDVNYKAAVSAASACQTLGFGHFIQSSTQATNTERAGQVPYSRMSSPPLQIVHPLPLQSIFLIFILKRWKSNG